MLTLEQLRTFLATVRAGSLSRAADELFLTQPAVSQRLKQLEEIVGTPLLIRTNGQPLRLTAAGEIVLKRTDDIMAKLEQLQVEVYEQFKAGDVSSLAIASGASAASHLLPEVLEALVRRDPHIATSIRQGTANEISEMVLSGEADIGIQIESAKSTELEKVPFKVDRLGLISAASEMPDCSRQGLQALTRRLFALQTHDSVLRQIVDQWAKSSGLRLSIGLETMNLEAIEEFVLHGLGLAILPEFTVRGGVQDGRLRFTPLFGLPVGLPLYVVFDPRRPLTRPAHLFLQVVESGHWRDEPWGWEEDRSTD